MNKRTIWRALSVIGVVASISGWQALGGGRGEGAVEARPLAGHVGVDLEITSRGALAPGSRAEPDANAFRLIGPNVPQQQSSQVVLCQATCGPFYGVDARACPTPCSEPTWREWQPIPWEAFAQGEYVGPARTPDVAQYHLRVNDTLEIVYWFTYEASDEAYRFEVGDEVMVESFTDAELNRGSLLQGRGLPIQPDGTITLRLLGQVPAVGRTVDELRADLEQRYLRLYKDPGITVTPLKTNARLEALRSAIDARFGTGGQVRRVKVTPEGSIQLPGIGSVYANCLTISELEREIEERYAAEVGRGVNTTVTLAERAPSFIYVLGEVARPGQLSPPKPVTVLQAISIAGSWNNGANLREIVVLRRTEDWGLIATRLDLRGALLGQSPAPADEIWLRDSDIVIVPKSPILLTDDFINLVFTRGIYGIIPISGSYSFSRASTL